MYRLAKYQSSAIAQLHAAHLREHGVMAGVIDASISAVTSLYGGAIGGGQYELVLSTKRASDWAAELLEELKLNPPHIEEGWEDDVQPDLSMLDPRHLPPCPSCGTTLSLSRPFGPCMRCHTKYDMMQLVFDRFGPEALASCYEQTEPMAQYSDEEVCSIELDCPSCSYPLDGLAIESHCPECGTWFSRRELFGNILSPNERDS